MKFRLILISMVCVWVVSCSLSLPNQQTADGTPSSTTPEETIPTEPFPAFAAKTPSMTSVALFPTCESDPSAALPLAPAVVVPAPLQNNVEGSTPSLRALADARGFLIGAAVDPEYLGDAGVGELLGREFNVLTPGNAMKWDAIHPEAGHFDFTKGDSLVAFAQSRNMAVRGHTLVWSQQLPSWVMEGDFSREQWVNILCTHIKTVVSHYRGLVFAWDVVNEAFDDQGLLLDNLWLRTIGPQYIPMAFQWAHEADPQALLFYNDHAADGLNRKSQAIYALVRGMQEMGIPIHGVGLQMHVWLGGPPTQQDLQLNLRRFAELGIVVHITEMDVRTQYSSQSLLNKLEWQAQVYRGILSTCLAAPNCKAFITWGLTDRYSWIPEYTGRFDVPLLFDFNGQPKPAYYVVRDLLQAP